jgi:transcriptional regulator with XRE-family HTH domain
VKATRRFTDAHRLTQQEVAEGIGVHRIQVVGWESGQAEPRSPRRRAYAHLLAGFAAQHPEVPWTTKRAEVC